MRVRILMYPGRVVIGVLTAAVTFIVYWLLKPQTIAPSILLALVVYIVLVRYWGRLMRQRRPLRVTVTRTIAAPPGQVWSLLSGAEAWSLRPGHYAFDVAPLAGQPLRVVLRVGQSGRVGCVPYELTELPASPDQTARSLTMRVPGPAGTAVAHTVRVAPDGSGAQVVITGEALVQRAGALAGRAEWRAELGCWLDEGAAVLAGHRYAPTNAVPSDVLAALAAPLPSEGAIEVSASALIAAAPARVWRVIWDPSTTLRMPATTVIAAGLVPGSPVGQAGEIQYFVNRDERRGGPLRAHLHYARATEPGHMAVGRISGTLSCEVLHRIEPAAGGTSFTLTYRFAEPKVIRERVQADLDAEVTRYKSLIEGAGTLQEA